MVNTIQTDGIDAKRAAQIIIISFFLTIHCQSIAEGKIKLLSWSTQCLHIIISLHFISFQLLLLLFSCIHSCSLVPMQTYSGAYGARWLADGARILCAALMMLLLALMSTLLNALAIILVRLFHLFSTIVFHIAFFFSFSNFYSIRWVFFPHSL